HEHRHDEQDRHRPHQHRVPPSGMPRVPDQVRQTLADHLRTPHLHTSEFWWPNGLTCIPSHETVKLHMYRDRNPPLRVSALTPRANVGTRPSVDSNSSVRGTQPSVV